MSSLAAIGDYGASVREWIRLSAGGRLRQPSEYVGARLTFADGTTSRVFRETRTVDVTTVYPTLLVIAFRLAFLGDLHRSMLGSATSACSTRRCSPGSAASGRSCGWTTSTRRCTAVCTSGTARTMPSPTPGGWSGCWRRSPTGIALDSASFPDSAGWTTCTILMRQRTARPTGGGGSPASKLDRRRSSLRPVSSEPGLEAAVRPGTGRNAHPCPVLPVPAAARSRPCRHRSAASCWAPRS